MNKETKESIQKTKHGFEASFKEGSLYNKQTQDDEHIHRILETLSLTSGAKVLDLGTGSGYLTFAIAENHPDCQVTGLDIVEETLQDNREKAQEKHLANTSFLAYDGVLFPFHHESFDCVTTRYALHHFPQIQDTFAEINRILKKGGTFFIADPMPNEDDTERFVDDYMQMKKDGHMKYYTKDEFVSLAEQVGLHLKGYFETTIRFPRLRETAYGFDDIMAKHDPKVIAGYQVKETEDHKYIYITQRVGNLLFEK